MAWRIHLSDDVIYRMDILTGEPSVLCVWVAGDEAAFFDLATGAMFGRYTFRPLDASVAARSGEAWAKFLDGLRAPNSAVLPYVRLRSLTIHSTSDGAQRVYDDGHGLTVAIDGHEVPLASGGAALVSVSLDATMGVMAALDEAGRLYIYQQHIPIGMFPLGLSPEAGVLPELVVADNAAAIIATDGRRLVRADNGGIVRKQREMSYFIGKLACSRDGNYVVTSDSETGILRVYQGDGLAFTHQKFAVDLYAKADALQLMADTPTPRLGVSALAISNTGLIAFAMEGIVTVTHISAMEKMPRPQSLL
jgi:hypothetical protein